MKGKLPDTHDWEMRGEEKTKKKGRASGSIVVRKKKEKWEEWEIIGRKETGIMHMRITEKGEEMKK